MPATVPCFSLRRPHFCAAARKKPRALARGIFDATRRRSRRWRMPLRSRWRHEADAGAPDIPAILNLQASHGLCHLLITAQPSAAAGAAVDALARFLFRIAAFSYLLVQGRRLFLATYECRRRQQLSLAQAKRFLDRYRAIARLSFRPRSSRSSAAVANRYICFPRADNTGRHHSFHARAQPPGTMLAYAAPPGFFDKTQQRRPCRIVYIEHERRPDARLACCSCIERYFS